MRESGEMYLETIYILYKNCNNIHAIDIANKMSYSKASVSRALSHLKSENFISIDNSGKIHLTSTGKNLAKSIYRRHILIKEILEKIGVSTTTADIDACRIEHYISKETFDALVRLKNKL